MRVRAAFRICNTCRNGAERMESKHRMTHIGRTTIAVLAVSWVFDPGGVAQAQSDFEGIWAPNVPPVAGQPALSDLRFTPEGQAALESFNAENDPSFRCIMPGVPRGLIDPYPLEIIQQDHQIVFLHEYYHQVRRIYLDGREAPEHWPPTLNGYSTGHWEGETLVIRTTHLSPNNYMDINGRPFSGDERTYVIEQYTRSDDVLSMTAEIHDPAYYEEPYVMQYSWAFTPDGEIWEYECDPQFGDVD